jgi:hypothetical protein
MSTVRYVNDLGNGHSGLLDVGNGLPVLTGLSIPSHDSITLSYTGTNLTGVVYKTGGASGATVATLVLTYDGSEQSNVGNQELINNS